MLNKYKISKNIQNIKYRKMIIFIPLSIYIISSLSLLSYDFTIVNNMIHFNISMPEQQKNITIIMYIITTILVLSSAILLSYFDAYYEKIQCENEEFKHLPKLEKQKRIRLKKLNTI